MTDKPQEAILALGTDGYFNLMAKLMGKDSPAGSGRRTDRSRAWPRSASCPASRSMSTKLDPAVQAALKDIPHGTEEDR